MSDRSASPVDLSEAYEEATGDYRRAEGLIREGMSPAARASSSPRSSRGSPAGATVQRVDFAGYPLPAKLTTLGMGSLLGRAPARGAWRSLPRAALVAGAAGVVAVGIALPVFGASLALFLLLDALAGRLPGRRDAQPLAS